MNPNPKDSGDKTMHTVVLSRAGMVLASFAWLMPPTVRATELPPLPQTVTSFGAAVTGDALYLYGGHTGRAHHYYHEGQADTLWRLDLKQPNAWEALNEGPGLQGLAMVAHGGKLYRIGGFTARNPEDQDADLWSQAAVACYDPAVGRWQDLTPLPEPRSSFDAAVLDDKVYVIGGWRIAGGRDATWHKTAWTMDLSADSPSWQALPEPPFERRALAVAAFDGKMFAIGGMQREGGPTTRVDIYDPADGRWSQGPSLQGEPMDGFGCSAFAVGKHLYVTTSKGNLQRLAGDGRSWETVRQLETSRFFHRLLPLPGDRLLSVGGANMDEGKFEDLEIIVP
jgi:N-acetylneuraminic acid mutarotase